jgi:hypothetical protein
MLRIRATEEMWPQNPEVEQFVSKGSPHHGQTSVTKNGDKGKNVKVDDEESNHLSC